MTDKTNPYGVPDTGHVWDDNLRELTNPPPKWWTIGLHASWIFVLAYGILYPMWPMVNSATEGFLGWTSIKEYKEDLQAIETVRGKYEQQLKGTELSAILGDRELTQYAVRSANVLFGDNCAACHGAGGQGNPGYPVLADDNWLYGGKVETIAQTIINGRQGSMPAKGGQQMTDAEINELATAISKAQPTSTPLFMEKGCFACHGPDGKGMEALGSADLTDQIWRFGNGSVADVRYTITHGVNDPSSAQTRNAVMPSFGTKMTDTDIKKLAVYVHQLGGGQ